MTTKGNELQLLPSTIVQLSEFFSLLKKKTKNPCATVLTVLSAEVKKVSVIDALREWGRGVEEMPAIVSSHFQLIPACFPGASSPARPATPLVPCSSTTPPPPPPRPPSRPKLPPGKPGVGDVVCSLLSWLAQTHTVGMTNRSHNA